MLQVPAPVVAGSEDLGTLPPVFTPDAPTAAPSLPSESPTQPPEYKPDATMGVKHDARHESSFTDFLSPPQADDELGRLGKYRILKILGHGGMGVVYKAEDLKLERSVALKAMLPTLAASAAAAEAIPAHEARAMAKVEHDHVVRIYQVDDERGIPFMAMEFLKGEPLDDRLKRDEKLPLDEVLRIGREIAEGLSAAHSTGLIHRDIKPANIWLESRVSGGVVSSAKASAGDHSPLTTHHSPGRVKILDFGLARAASQEAGLTQQGAIIGTPAFMSPEQARGENVDARTDLFSLGVVLYRMCTNQQPFQGKDTVSTLMEVVMTDPAAPIKINKALPMELSKLVMKLLQKDPAKRTGSAAEVVQAIQAIETELAWQKMQKTKTEAMAKGEPSPARGRVAPAATGRSRGSARRPVALFAVGLIAVFAVFCLVLAGGGIFYWQTNNGIVVIEINDPEIQVSFDKKDLVFKGADTQEIRVGPGEFGMHVKRGDLEFDTDKPIIVKRGDVVRLKVSYQVSGKNDLGQFMKKIAVEQGERELGKKEITVGPVPPKIADRKVSEKRMMEGFDDVVWSVAFAPDGRSYLAAGGINQLYDRQSGRELRRFLPGAAWFAAFSSDGGRVLTGGSSTEHLVIWDASNGKPLQKIAANAGRVRNGAFSPDGTLVIANHANTVRVWNLSTGKLLAVFDADGGSQHSFQIVPGARRLLVANPDHSIRVVDMTTWKEVDRWKPHPDPICDMDISPDGSTLVVCTNGNEEPARLWDVASGREVGQLGGGLGKGPNRRAVFAPDRRRVISTNADADGGTIILWDVASRTVLQRWEKQGDIVSVAVAPDGRDALFGQGSRKAFLMRLPDPSPVAGVYALQFGEKATVTMPSLIVGRDGPLTFEGFITPGAKSGQVIVGNLHVLYAGKAWSFAALGTIQIAGKPEPGKRAHIAGVRTDKEIRLYENGKLVGAKSIAAGKGQPPQVSPLHLGDGVFDGLISEVRISKIARYDKDFTPPKRFEPDKDTLALYHFDEGSSDVLHDSSGNKHDGKIVGAKWVKADGMQIKELLPAKSSDAPTTIDLVPLARPDAKFGTWKREGDKLVSIPPPGKNNAVFLSILPIETKLPREFAVEAVIERVSGVDAVAFFIPAFGTDFMIALDGYPGNGSYSGLSYIGGKDYSDNETTIRGRQLVNGKKHTIRITVRAAGVAADLDGKTLFDYRGGYGKITPKGLEVGGSKFFVQIIDSPYRIHSLRLIPLEKAP